MKKSYEISYLPIARKDIFDLMLYIADQLHAPDSALRIVDAVDNAVKQLATFPYSYPVYRLIRPLATEYRLLPVENYNVFYTVSEDCKIVEIHRALYAKMDVIKKL
ncbi:MAG: type II toxin-antitoxin system RelE/ParE family toxin [Eubacteriales bacterium]|nr:type II toxin-antitoxin system RelE/ParE family toxin [Eubacteriales bacterium]